MYQPFVPNLDSTQMKRDMYHPAMHHHLMLARAYVIDQPYTGLFTLDKALMVGTIFPNMYEAFPKRK